MAVMVPLIVREWVATHSALLKLAGGVTSALLLLWSSILRYLRETGQLSMADDQTLPEQDETKPKKSTPEKF